MNVLVLNSSPKEKGFSVTKVLTEKLVEGMCEENANVEVFNLNQMSIHTCMDCGSCATISQGKCVMKDDMTDILFSKFIETDILVLATPVYFGMMNSVMKKFIERLYPFLGPYQIVQGEGVYQAFRGSFPKIVAISAASWHYSHVFDQISSYFHYLFGDKLVGELYRGSSDAFLYGAMFYEKKQEILGAAKCAGKELIQNGCISHETVKKVCQDVGTLDKTVTMHNLCLKLCEEENVNIIQYARNRIEDHGAITPRTLDSFLDVIQLFYKEVEEDVNFSVQITTKGKQKDSCYFVINHGMLEKGKGTLENPDLTLKTSLDTLVDIVCKKVEIMEMILKGRLIVKGKKELLDRVTTYLFAQ